MDAHEDRLAAEQARGLLGTSVLAVLAEEEAHGYAVAVRLRELGLADLRAGAVYPALTRLEEEGTLAASWTEGAGGPGRKVYRLTTTGRERLQALVELVRERADVLDGLARASTTPGATAPGVVDGGPTTTARTGRGR